jgi:hypothetical protein
MVAAPASRTTLTPGESADPTILAVSSVHLSPFAAMPSDVHLEKTPNNPA